MSPWRARITSIPDAVWGPLAAGMIILAVGITALVARQPWLFASLGPTAFLQAESPQLPSSRLYNTVIGHLVGMGVGFFAVWVLSADAAPSVLATGQVPAERVWASVVAIALTSLILGLLRASHPPAAATTLLIALGAFKLTLHDAIMITVGVAIVSAVGELLRILRFQERPGA